jgi:hypothetical protein
MGLDGALGEVAAVVSFACHGNVAYRGVGPLVGDDSSLEAVLDLVLAASVCHVLAVEEALVSDE